MEGSAWGDRNVRKSRRGHRKCCHAATRPWLLCEDTSAGVLERSVKTVKQRQLQGGSVVELRADVTRTVREAAVTKVDPNVNVLCPNSPFCPLSPPLAACPLNVPPSSHLSSYVSHKPPPTATATDSLFLDSAGGASFLFGLSHCSLLHVFISRRDRTAGSTFNKDASPPDR